MSDWKEQLFTHWELINRLAVRRFGQRALAEEAALAVIDSLAENDGQRLRAYDQRASFEAYLATVSFRLLEDFSRKRFGRRRAPLWVRNLGGIWLKLFRLLCLERVTRGEAVELLVQEELEDNRGAIELAAEDIIERITDCGSHQGLEVEFSDDVELQENQQTDSSPQEQQLEENQKSELFRQLLRSLTESSGEVVEHNASKLSTLQIPLHPREKLLLKLCFQDNMNTTLVAHMLGLTRHQVNGRLRRLLARLRKEIVATGIDQEIVALLR